MGSKSIVTAGFAWLVLVCFLSFLVLIMPNKKTSHQETVSASISAPQTKKPLVARRIPTPTQPVGTKVRVGTKAELKAGQSFNVGTGEATASRVQIKR